MVLAVDHRHLRRGVGQGLGGVKSGKACADDYYSGYPFGLRHL